MINRKSRVNIAFIGTEKGVGVTYLAISYGTYMSYVCKKRVALIECNKSGHFNQIKQAAAIETETSRFYLRGIDWYPYSKENMWLAFNQDRYDMILLDYGEFEPKQVGEYMKSDFYFFIGSLCEWKRDSFKKILGFYEKCPKQAILMASLAKKYDIHLFDKEFHVRLRAVPCVYDPFILDKEIKQFWGSVETIGGEKNCIRSRKRGKDDRY